MAKNPGFVQPDTDLRLNKPEIFVEVDRARAADMGVSVDAVARTVETMLGGRAVTRYKRDADQYDVIVQTEHAAAAPRPRTSKSCSCAAAAKRWCR